MHQLTSTSKHLLFAQRPNEVNRTLTPMIKFKVHLQVRYNCFKILTETHDYDTSETLESTCNMLCYDKNSDLVWLGRHSNLSTALQNDLIATLVSWS